MLKRVMLIVALMASPVVAETPTDKLIGQEKRALQSVKEGRA